MYLVRAQFKYHRTAHCLALFSPGTEISTQNRQSTLHLNIHGSEARIPHAGYDPGRCEDRPCSLSSNPYPLSSQAGIRAPWSDPPGNPRSLLMTLSLYPHIHQALTNFRCHDRPASLIHLTHLLQLWTIQLRSRPLTTLVACKAAQHYCPCTTRRPLQNRITHRWIRLGLGYAAGYPMNIQNSAIH